MASFLQLTANVVVGSVWITPVALLRPSSITPCCSQCLSILIAPFPLNLISSPHLTTTGLVTVLGLTWHAFDYL
ncbi:hypothetical protein F5Y16DRAFT_382125 [Xylariaceae sp. FL0255]|nr:hypothetical protein F5Y16DRAFT_382125 [Xylariaceae sp. FL0255]